MVSSLNKVQMAGTLVERSALRFTPAGVPVVEVQVQHRSRVVEGGLDRDLDFALDAIAIGDLARQLAAQALGGEIELSGFLAPRTRNSPRLRLHVLEIGSRAEPAGDEAASQAGREHGTRNIGTRKSGE